MRFLAKDIQNTESLFHFRVVEFASRKDMERALKKLDGLEINGKPIKLEIVSKIYFYGVFFFSFYCLILVFIDVI